MGWWVMGMCKILLITYYGGILVATFQRSLVNIAIYGDVWVYVVLFVCWLSRSTSSGIYS